MTLSYICAWCVAVSLLLASADFASAQSTNYYSTNGTEYAIVGTLPGDQVFPDVAVSPTGGFLVWQDNNTDGSGWGIGARRLDSTFSGALSTFRVNQIGAGDQEHPRVALLKNGGAVFVWQGGQLGLQHVYAAFLNASNTFTATNDILVNTFTNYFQINPAVAVLTNGNVVVLWASYDEANTNSLQDVYGQILTPSGAKVGGEFLVNQFTSFNQRTPAVAALPTGGFVASWVSEQQSGAVGQLGSNTVYTTAANSLTPGVDIYARLFNSNGVAAGNEFRVSSDGNVCANPAVAVAPNGSYLMVWGELSRAYPANSWDIYSRPFTNSIGGSQRIVNSHLLGDQYNPRVCAIAYDYLVSWTSLGQDGSREGVYGQFVHNNGAPVNGEFRINTTTAGPQLQAAVASDGVSEFLAVWTGPNGGVPFNFDLYAQQYANVLAVLHPLSAPFVWVPFTISNNAYVPQLVVTWDSVQPLAISNYQVYVDGAITNAGLVTTNQWIMTAANGLTANATHSFQVSYVVADGRQSPISASTSGTTWSGANYYGIPFEWLEQYYGLNFALWPSNPNAPLTPRGLTLTQVFLSGGNPTNSATWLHQTLTRTAQGMFLNWNTQPGATYQVQVTTNFTSWSNVGSPRFAARTSDSIPTGNSPVGYYRVLLLRQ